jgi:nitrite reductase (NADH) small subunit
MKMNEWSVICRIDEIPVLGSRRVERPQGMDVAVFRNSEDQVFAVLDRCPHKGGPLSQGIVFGTSVACPLHNWTIELGDGCARAPDLGCVPKFACKVEGGQVLLDPHELATHAIDLQPPRSGPGATTGALGDQTYQVQAPHGA